MKKTLIAIFAFAVVLSFGCDGTDNPPQVEGYGTGVFDIVTIDSCEYIVTDVYYGYYFIHKQNCKYCAERNTPAGGGNE